MQGTWVQSLGQKYPQGKELETHSSILAGEIWWTEESGRLQSMESPVTQLRFSTHLIREASGLCSLNDFTNWPILGKRSHIVSPREDEWCLVNILDSLIKSNLTCLQINLSHLLICLSQVKLSESLPRDYNSITRICFYWTICIKYNLN